jgi:hypothetical protein
VGKSPAPSYERCEAIKIAREVWIATSLRSSQ